MREDKKYFTKDDIVNIYEYIQRAFSILSSNNSLDHHRCGREIGKIRDKIEPLVESFGTRYAVFVNRVGDENLHPFDQIREVVPGGESVYIPRKVPMSRIDDKEKVISFAQKLIQLEEIQSVRVYDVNGSHDDDWGRWISIYAEGEGVNTLF